MKSTVCVNKVQFNQSKHLKNHLFKIISEKDDKIKELEREIEKLQDLRVENEVMRTKMIKMGNFLLGLIITLEKRIADLQQEILSHNKATTIARKVERDHEMFIRQLMNKKRSTSPEDSRDYIHVTKYRELKDKLIAEKCHSKDMKKEMYSLEKIVRNLRMANEKMQETVREFVNKSHTPKSPNRATHRKLSEGANKRSTPIKGSRPNPNFGSELGIGFYINKHLNKLENFVNEFDIIDELKKDRIQAELKNLSIKRLKIVSGYRKIGQAGYQFKNDNDSEYSQEFSDNEGHNLPQINQTMTLSVDESMQPPLSTKSVSSRRGAHSTLRISNKSGTPIKMVLQI